MRRWYNPYQHKDLGNYYSSTLDLFQPNRTSNVISNTSVVHTLSNNAILGNWPTLVIHICRIGSSYKQAIVIWCEISQAYQYLNGDLSMSCERGSYFQTLLGLRPWASSTYGFATYPFTIQHHIYHELNYEEAAAKLNSSFKIKVGFISTLNGEPIKLAYKYDGKGTGKGRFTIDGKSFCKFSLKG